MGMRTRTRVCRNRDTTPCLPDADGVLTEQLGPCPVVPCPGVWSEWQDWSECSTTCGPGLMSRKRTCLGGKEGGPGCEGMNKEPAPCTGPVCMGMWTDWVPAGLCSVTCGAGVVKEERTCLGGKVGGPGCDGLAMRLVDCSFGECVVRWSPWSDWTECDKTCNGGMKQRIRLVAVVGVLMREIWAGFDEEND